MFQTKNKGIQFILFTEEKFTTTLGVEVNKELLKFACQNMIRVSTDDSFYNSSIWKYLDFTNDYPDWVLKHKDWVKYKFLHKNTFDFMFNHRGICYRFLTKMVEKT